MTKTNAAGTLSRKSVRTVRRSRITTQTVLDILEVPQRSRRAGTYRRLAKLMAELGWSAVRVRGLTRGGYLEQVRGYCRDTRQQPFGAQSHVQT